ERRQILALKVLDDRDLERSLVVDVLDERRDRFESGLPGGTPATLSGDQLERAGSQRTDQDRLKDAVLPNARRELGDRLLDECHPRLLGVRLDAIQRNVAD